MIRFYDNKEPLVDVRAYCSGVKIILGKERLKKEKTAFVRLGVAKKLRTAQKLLPEGMNFVIRDAWRPAYVQAEIFFWFLSRIRTRYIRTNRVLAIREKNSYHAMEDEIQ